MMPGGPLPTRDSRLARPATASTLAVRGVTKHYRVGDGESGALNDVSLDIHPGELTALMGPSGSGKTTLLSIMGGILRPTRGQVVVCGRDIGGASERERSRVRLAHIGFVFQSYNLFSTLSARQNVEIALDLKGIGGKARQVQALALLERMELGGKADAHPSDLSGGQKQRVAIARALAGEPSILLADEPTAALDSANGRRIMMLFRDLAKAQRRAIVIVTHDTRIINVADRVITIEDGCIIGDAPTIQRTTRPAPLSLVRPIGAINSELEP